MASRIIWNIPPQDYFARLFDNYTQAVRRAVIAIMTKRAAEIEAWMKVNAIWIDRTGNARQTLWAEPFVELATIGVVFGHGMEYGWKYLEFIKAGKYSIIMPALDHWTPIIIDDMKKLMGRP